MKIFGAYVHARPDCSIFYVGKGTEKRAHNLKRNGHHGNVVRKHGAENILVGFIPCSSEAISLELEIGLIKCLHRSGVSLTNKTVGGEGVSGLQHTAESRAKMSLLSRQKWCDPNHRQKMSDAHKGAIISPDNMAKLIAANTGKQRPIAVREKISAAQKGRIFSAEQRKNIGAAQLGKKHTIERREKISAAIKARWQSETHRAKMAAAHSNRPPASEETRKKLSEAWKHRAPLSSEAYANIRAAAKLRETRKINKRKQNE